MPPTYVEDMYQPMVYGLAGAGRRFRLEMERTTGRSDSALLGCSFRLAVAGKSAA